MLLPGNVKKFPFVRIDPNKISAEALSKSPLVCLTRDLTTNSLATGQTKSRHHAARAISQLSFEGVSCGYCKVSGNCAMSMPGLVCAHASCQT